MKIKKYDCLYGIFLCCFYLLFVIYCVLVNGKSVFVISFDYYIVQKLVLLVFPVYIVLFFIGNERLRLLDYCGLLMPIVVWFLLTFILGGKSGTNFFIVELPAVILLSLVYGCTMYTIPVLRGNDRSWIKIIILCLLCILAVLVYILVPALNE